MKKVLLVLILLFPIFINASECNYQRHQEYSKYTPNISYDNNYSMGGSTFTITVYNVIEGLKVVYDKKEYLPDDQDQVVINYIPEGKHVSLKIYGDDGCTSQLRTITVDEPYYNPFLNSEMCSGYKDILTYCTARFLSVDPTEDLIKAAIKNYNMNIIQEPEVVVENKTFIDKAKEFALNYGIKGGLVVVTIFLSFLIYSNKLRKLEHGI